MITVFLSSPYSNGSQAANVKRQMDAADEVIRIGMCPIVPLLSHFQHMVHPQGYDTWMAIDKEMLSRSDVLVRLRGKSVGADLEVSWALALKIPVVGSISDLKREVARGNIVSQRSFRCRGVRSRKGVGLEDSRRGGGGTNGLGVSGKHRVKPGV